MTILVRRRRFCASALPVSLGLVALCNTCQYSSPSQFHGRLTFADDDVGRGLRLVVEEVVQDLLGSVGVTPLCVEGSTRVMGSHAVASVQRVLHGTPYVLLWGGLDVPDVTCIAVKMPALDSSSDILRVTDGTTGSVDYNQSAKADFDGAK